MRSKVAAVFLVFALLTGTANAQVHPGTFKPETRQAWHVASWVSVIAVEAADTWASWRSPNRKRAFGLQAVRVGGVEASTFLLKKAFPEPRPCTALGACGSDSPDSGMPSGHMSLACSTVGGPSLGIVIPLDAFTAFGRWAAWRHNPVQLTVGCIIGILFSRIR